MQHLIFDINRKKQQFLNDDILQNAITLFSSENSVDFADEKNADLLIYSGTIPNGIFSEKELDKCFANNVDVSDEIKENLKPIKKEFLMERRHCLLRSGANQKKDRF